MAAGESCRKGGDEVDLIGRQGRVGGGVLDEQVSQAVEFGGRMCFSLRPLDVGED